MKNKRSLKAVITDILAFIAGCSMVMSYTFIFLERVLAWKEELCLKMQEEKQKRLIIEN